MLPDMMNSDEVRLPTVQVQLVGFIGYSMETTYIFLKALKMKMTAMKVAKSSSVKRVIKMTR